ncbi:cuticular protein 72Ea [Cochliomyia hominivorax]
MNFCFAFLALVLVGATQVASVSYLVAPALRSYPIVYGSQTSSIITPVQQQYHTQDELGQYAYGYSDPLSTKQEVRSLDGVTRGSYSYRDANDILQTVDYRADDSGFHVAATNLPKPVQQETFRLSAEPSVSHTISAAADPTNSLVSSDPDTESITSARAFGETVHLSGGMRLAESTASHTKSFADPANVRSMELSQPVADSFKVALTPANTIYIKEKPQKMLVSTPIAVASVPIAKALVPKIYTYGYPITKHVYSHGFYY